MLYGFFVISASVGLVIALAQLPGGLADAPGALPTQGTLEVCVGHCTHTLSYDDVIKACTFAATASGCLFHPLMQSQGIGIDIGAIVVLSLLFRSDWKVRLSAIRWQFSDSSYL